MSFQSLGLHPELLRAVEKRGYLQATPIQIQAIPVAMQGGDILGCAQTGTGKTAAFALPILHRLQEVSTAAQAKRTEACGDASHRDEPSARRRRSIRALILVPTRELAMQVGTSFSDYGKGLGLRRTIIFGGVSQRPQVDDLRRGVDIVVATPGRFLDLASQGHLQLADVQVLVLDEADQMFDMGFIRDVRKIIRLLPRKRQTMLFSATMPAQIRDLAKECLIKPVGISVSPQAVTPDKIEQQVCYVQAADKPSILIDFLSRHSGQRTLVFCRTKHGADKIVRKLQGADIAAVAIHGNKSQNARHAALNAFKMPQPPVLVATDVAARGLHMPDVNIVVNYELSDTPETYVHRIGRTARADASGRAVTFCAPDERSLMQRIEYLTKVRLGVIPVPNGMAKGEPVERVRLNDGPRRPNSNGHRRDHEPAHRANGFGSTRKKTRSVGRATRFGSAKPRRFAASSRSL